MVFAINPPAYGNTFDAFKARAIKQGSSNTTSPVSGAYPPTGHVWNVDVGPNGQLKFQPPIVYAKKGDKVAFKL